MRRGETSTEELAPLMLRLLIARNKAARDKRDEKSLRNKSNKPAIYRKDLGK